MYVKVSEWVFLVTNSCGSHTKIILFVLCVCLILDLVTEWMEEESCMHPARLFGKVWLHDGAGNKKLLPEDRLMMEEDYKNEYHCDSDDEESDDEEEEAGPVLRERKEYAEFMYRFLKPLLRANEFKTIRGKEKVVRICSSIIGSIRGSLLL